MSTRRFRSLDDFSRARVYLGVRCEGCGHSATFAPGDVTAWMRGRSSVEMVAGKMRCTVCGHRGAVLFPVEIERQKVPALPMPLPDKPRR